MIKSSEGLCIIIAICLAEGCQVDNPKESPEVVVVSEQLSGELQYNIDLTRNDAIFLVAP